MDCITHGKNDLSPLFGAVLFGSFFEVFGSFVVLLFGGSVKVFGRFLDLRFCCFVKVFGRDIKFFGFYHIANKRVRVDFDYVFDINDNGNGQQNGDKRIDEPEQYGEQSATCVQYAAHREVLQNVFQREHVFEFQRFVFVHEPREYERQHFGGDDNCDERQNREVPY